MESAYEVQFIGSSSTSFEALIWKSWAPPKCKVFSWLAIQNRIWTADRLAARGWPHNNSCVLCRATQETEIHLFADCRFVRRIWAAVNTWAGFEGPRPLDEQHFLSLEDWWSRLARVPSNDAKGLRSLIMLVVWEIWLERNARIFKHKETPRPLVISRIKDQANSWKAAGAKHLAALLA